jgi:hypothetical protein
MIDDLWLAVLTKNEDDAGSNNRLNLTVNIHGDDVFDQDFYLGLDRDGALEDGLLEGQAGLGESLALPAPFEANALTNSSIRLGIRGDDAWGARHALLIGRTQPAFEPGRIVALAMETDLADWLSADASEGHLTMRLRLVGAGTSTTVIRRVLLLVYTAGASNADTESSIQLQIAAGGAVVLHQKITDDLDKFTAHWFFLDVETPFARGDIAANGSIRLSILGTDAWLPKTVFMFGLDTAADRPNEVVTLVSMPEWGLGWLSTDPQEGSSSVDLSLSI